MELMRLKELWQKEEQYAFEGWDFSHIDGRWDEEKLVWSYKEIVLEYLKEEDQLLDMGTGGGEFLLKLQHPYHLTSVTEAYAPNVRICKERLAPLGIQVEQVDDDCELPLENEQFDIVINRHEAFCASEVSRILKKGGYFITQQVGGRNDSDLSARLIEDFAPMYPEHDLKNNIALLSEAGFEIIRAEERFSPVRFYDVGALVYFAKIIQWEFAGFSVEKCFKQLCELQKEIKENKYIEGTKHRFLIVARKR